MNQAFLTLLETPEPSVLAENAKRNQLQALFSVNRNRASANYDQPYPELADLFEAIAHKIQARSGARQIEERITGPAATYYNATYGANGTGQTPQQLLLRRFRGNDSSEPRLHAGSMRFTTSTLR
ncbi:MAG: hypothetical protein L0387_25795 [Acidobacteria bacterium]|nr:hypothetical protein [Acidobacteriota bacterium]MCI0719317.1 hypothetical protein [Acidobacteriota bacterium]